MCGRDWPVGLVPHFERSRRERPAGFGGKDPRHDACDEQQAAKDEGQARTYHQYWRSNLQASSLISLS
jgi:hypothetical protein